jgi:hypothetical protein
MLKLVSEKKCVKHEKCGTQAPFIKLLYENKCYL